jgi:hypothetical protein
MRLSRTQVFLASIVVVTFLLYMMMGSSDSRDRARVDQPDAAPNDVAAAARQGTVRPPPRHVHSGNAGAHGGLLTTAPFEHLVGLRALDTRTGDSIPADRAGEDQEWVDVAKFVEARGPRRTRVLKPNSMATMDYVPARLNIHLDDEGKIARLAMG